ncbi:hypothetical protein HRbin11_02069 [bacterium HR11]|nr:hypothetical protein HRbin11_02069 [bacterium HR11]
MATVKERVNVLEVTLTRFIEEMRAFKDEMLAFKEEMRVFKEEMRAFKDEMLAFKEEMRAFKEEMRAFKEEVREDRRQMNKRWGELAQKMGTLVEDLVFPATAPVIRKYFQCEPVRKAIRFLCRRDGQEYEVDILAVCPETVFMIEVRSRPKPQDVDDILEKASQFWDFFPEYRGKALIVIFASLVFPEGVIRYATRRGLYVMAFREWEYMDILNFEEVRRLREA